jgi:NAD(P)-dependent dehydrogenase (short-subunit alcohol dehydrogenase family)
LAKYPNPAAHKIEANRCQLGAGRADHIDHGGRRVDRHASLEMRQCSVVIACRTLPKAERAAAAMAGDVAIAHLDLADLASVRKFADSVDGVDVLINNAGVLGLPPT